MRVLFMHRRHLKLLSFWILPLLLLRALIPTGFMLSADQGSLQLTFCPAVVQPAKQVPEHLAHEHSLQHGHHADAGADAAASHNDDNAPCPFSLVASAAQGDVAHLHDSLIAPSDERFEFISAPTVRVGPVRTDRIRGPPTLA
jgi:hypothetical protein